MHSGQLGFDNLDEPGVALGADFVLRPGCGVRGSVPARDAPTIALMERSPLMYDAYKRYLADLRTVADQIEIYSMTGSISQYGSWGIREYAGQPLTETPKRRAVLEAIVR